MSPPAIVSRELPDIEVSIINLFFFLKKEKYFSSGMETEKVKNYQ